MTDGSASKDSSQLVVGEISETQQPSPGADPAVPDIFPSEGSKANEDIRYERLKRKRPSTAAGSPENSLLPIEAVADDIATSSQVENADHQSTSEGSVEILAPPTSRITKQAANGELELGLRSAKLVIPDSQALRPDQTAESPLRPQSPLDSSADLPSSQVQTSPEPTPARSEQATQASEGTINHLFTHSSPSSVDHEKPTAREGEGEGREIVQEAQAVADPDRPTQSVSAHAGDASTLFEEAAHSSPVVRRIDDYSRITGDQGSRQPPEHSTTTTEDSTFPFQTQLAAFHTQTQLEAQHTQTQSSQSDSSVAHNAFAEVATTVPNPPSSCWPIPRN